MPIRESRSDSSQKQDALGARPAALALIAVLAAFRDYRAHLGPGERATIMVVAAGRKQARVIMRYVKGLLAIETLVSLVENETPRASIPAIE